MSQYHRTAHSGLLVFILCICTIAIPSAHAEPAPRAIKIGFLTDLSGFGTYWGISAAFGAKLAERALRGEGLDVSVIVGDHGFKTTAAVSEAEKMISLDKVEALYVEFTPLAVAVSSLVKQKKILFLNNSAATSITDDNPHAFKAYLDYEKGCKEIARHWKNNGIKRVGMLALPTEFAALCRRGAETIFPNMFIKEFNVSEPLINYMHWFKTKKIEAVLNPSFESDALNMLKAMRQLRYFPRIGVSESDGLTKQVTEQYATILNRATCFSFPKVSDEFRTLLKTHDGKGTATLIEAAAMSYVHVQQLARAILECEQGDIECQTGQMMQQGPDPTLSFIQWDGQIASYDFQLKEWQDGMLVTVGTFQ